MVNVIKINEHSIVRYFKRNIRKPPYSPYGDEDSCFFNASKNHIFPFLSHNNGYLVTVDVYTSSSETERKGGARFLLVPINVSFKGRKGVNWLAFNVYSSEIRFSNVLWAYIISRIFGFEDHNEIKDRLVLDYSLAESRYLGTRTPVHVNGNSSERTYADSFSVLVFGDFARPKTTFSEETDEFEDISYEYDSKFYLRCPVCGGLRSSFSEITYSSDLDLDYSLCGYTLDYVSEDDLGRPRLIIYSSRVSRLSF